MRKSLDEILIIKIYHNEKVILLAGILVAGAISANTISAKYESDGKSENKKESFSKEKRKLFQKIRIKQP
ncbi:hypothetical protein FY557_19960 [Chryseobacterium sp. SN22]|uniref:hypothetical protein n=1 Tax=Chryseobacterium sp. SN22 TaxID=2606431 RepID=UPI0011F014B9|nr:hypothetical protein [Chryseobacterium sp. SN22]KAA0125946.1 hypothetical protein FY557_19960 [Chryseobacterium sp. SN22]